MNSETLEKAIDIRDDLKQKNLPQPKILVDITGKFLKGFKKFPQMAQYDFTLDQMQILEDAQSNLNDNIGNEKLRNILIQTSKDVAKSLAEQYPNDWENPLKA